MALPKQKRRSMLCPSRAELAAEIAKLLGKDRGQAVSYGAQFDRNARPTLHAIDETAWHPATRLTSPTHRGTSNTNARGSAEDRRRRKQFLLDTWGDGYTTHCAFCRCELVWDTLTVDRYPIPGRLGGRYTRDNIRPACGPCNSEDRGLSALAEIVGAGARA